MAINFAYGLRNRTNRVFAASTSNPIINKPKADEPFPGSTFVTDDGGSVTSFAGDVNPFQFSNRDDIVGLELGKSVKTIGNSAFYNCDNLTGSLVIPDNVITIGSDAFAYCADYNGTLTLGNKLKSIGSYAFYNCSGFTGSLTIPNSVTNIGDEAFHGCSGLTSLTIPNSALNLLNGTFQYTSFTDAYLNMPLSSIEESVFSVSSLATIHLQPSPNTPAGWTIGSDQTIGGKSGVTVVADWTNYPN